MYSLIGAIASIKYFKLKVWDSVFHDLTITTLCDRRLYNSQSHNIQLTLILDMLSKNLRFHPRFHHLQ